VTHYSLWGLGDDETAAAEHRGAVDSAYRFGLRDLALVGDLGLIDLEELRSRSLRKPPCSDRFAYTKRQVGLGPTLVGMGESEVGKDIPAALPA